MSLDHLRDHLEKITKDLIDLLLERKNLVKQIQETKETKTKYWCYDPQREEKVFKNLKKNYPDLSLYELLTLSLIIEEQASLKEASYPRWSEREHLGNYEYHLYEQININLLQIFYPELFKTLFLKSSFDT